MSDGNRPRQDLSANITNDVRRVVQEELADSPLSESDADAIEKEILEYTTTILEALTISEMQSESAQLSHLANARGETQRLSQGRRKK